MLKLAIVVGIVIFASAENSTWSNVTTARNKAEQTILFATFIMSARNYQAELDANSATNSTGSTGKNSTELTDGEVDIDENGNTETGDPSAEENLEKSLQTIIETFQRCNSNSTQAEMLTCYEFIQRRALTIASEATSTMNRNVESTVDSEL